MEDEMMRVGSYVSGVWGLKGNLPQRIKRLAPRWSTSPLGASSCSQEL